MTTLVADGPSQLSSTARSIRSLARRLDRALSYNNAERTAEKLRIQLIAALDAASGDVIAELEDRGDGYSCQAWDDAVCKIDLGDIQRQIRRPMRLRLIF